MNPIIGATGLVICLLGLVQAISARQLEQETGRFFIALFAVLVAYVTFNLIGQFAFGQSGEMWAPVTRTAMFLESITPTLAMLLLCGLIFHLAGRAEWYRSTTFRVALALWLVYFVLLVVTQFTTFIYVIGPDNDYARGPLYPILLVPPVLMMLVNLYALWHEQEALSLKERTALAIYILVPMAFMVVQMIWYGVYFIVLGTSIGAFVMFSYVLNDQTERYYAQLAENERLYTQIMLSQIQPHFMCNTLGAIEELCKSDLEAKAAIHMFSRYLRENVWAIQSDELIPFEHELDHTCTYLELEQLRFGSDLTVAYDLDGTDFMIPTLTLQPLVENAVRHGVRQTQSGAGTVTLATREFADRWEVTVADDGAGFDPDAPLDDGRIHVGLANVRKRLRAMCDGSLQIDSAPGRGSRITIVLPKGRRSL